MEGNYIHPIAIPYENSNCIPSSLTNILPFTNSTEEEQSDLITIPNSVLTKLREQISSSLIQTKNLEERAKQLPLLLVQLSVLKEEKRLLQIQLKSKNQRIAHKSIGVGDGLVNDINITEYDSIFAKSPCSERDFLFGSPQAKYKQVQISPKKSYKVEELFGLKSYIELKKLHPYKRSRTESCPAEINLDEKDESFNLPNSNFVPKVPFPDVLPNKSEQKLLPDLTNQISSTHQFSLGNELHQHQSLPSNTSMSIIGNNLKSSSDFSLSNPFHYSKSSQTSSLQNSVSTDTDNLFQQKSVEIQMSPSISAFSTQTSEKLSVAQQSQTIDPILSQTSTSTTDLLLYINREPEVTEMELLSASSKSFQSDDEDSIPLSGNMSTMSDKTQDEESLANELEEFDSFHEIQQDDEEDFPVMCSEISMNPNNLDRFELDPKMIVWCRIINDNLLNPTQGSNELSQAKEEIQNMWFSLSSQPKSQAQCVEECLDVLDDISQELLKYVVNLTDGNGNTALHYAVSFGNYEVINILLDTKLIDINTQNKAGYTCIMLAAVTDVKNNIHLEILSHLLNLSDINFKALHNGQTALMLAASQGHSSAVQLMLEAGADVNLQDKDGSSALMCAAEHGHVEIVKKLLKHLDCDPFLTDNDGCMALTIAMDSGHKDVGVLIYAQTNLRSRSSSSLSKTSSKKLGNSKLF